MVNNQVIRQHVLSALEEIDKKGVPAKRKSTKYNLYHDNKPYPPKYVLSIATKIAVGKELEPSQFYGGDETNNFLTSLGFTILEGSKTRLNQDKKEVTLNKTIHKEINICTAVIQTEYSSDDWDDSTNKEKLQLLSTILQALNKDTDILVLPAGFINSDDKKAEAIFKDIEKSIVNLIHNNNNNLVICFGIDGRDKRDQLALAIDKTGIIAVARKFHHMTNGINLADNAFAKEYQMERHFYVKNKKAYLAVCYDIFGITRKKLANENNYDFIIGAIHGFDSSGGDSDFARKGLAGASKQWNVHTYASAVFSDNRNPTNWTSGVEWIHGNESVKAFSYKDIALKSELTIIEAHFAKVYFRYFNE